MKNLICVTLLILVFKTSSFGQITSATTGTNKNILLEAAMGSNLGFAPDAYCIQNGLENTNPQLIIINNHNTGLLGVTPLKYLTNDQWYSTYITGLPHATIDRVPYNNSIQQARNNWQAAINNRGTSASYQVTMSVVKTGQSLNVRLIGKALINLSGEYRFNVIVVEDSVIQNQRNNYTSGSCSFMSSGDPIQNFPHKNVLRAYLGTEWGLFKCTNPSANQLDTMNFSYTIPTNFNNNNIKIIGIIQKYDVNTGQREIMNSLRISLNSINMTNITGNYLYSNFRNVRAGVTVNNQQTNGTSYRRIQVLPSNRIGVTWTTSNDASPFLGRGTGYNQFNGNNWIKSDTTSTRIESQRSGFPSYAFNSTTNEESILSHIVTSNGLSGGFVLSRKNVTASTWNQSTVLDTIATVPGLLWCRTAVGNNYLHVVACYTDSTQNQPNRVLRNGVRTPIVYSRLNLSTNIWEIKTLALPGYNSLRYYNGNADTYSIDAIGNNVAILIGSPGQDLSLWKSGNSGSNWSRTIIDTFYQAPFIENSTVVDPEIFTTDDHLHVLLDNNGNSHCFWTQLVFYNTDITDGSWNYYPASSNQQLKYWKEGTSLNNKSTIATFNGDPINITNWQQFASGNNSRYGTSYYLAHPSAGISLDGKIYCIYSSPTQGENNIGARDIYALYSTNSGQTWSTPKNLTSILGSGLEQAFPSIARTVNDKIHIVYSQSGSVGPNTAGQWDINYYAVDTGALDLNDSLIAGQQVSFSLSDSILCKGNSLYYSINNSQLYANDTLIASGNVTNGIYTPQSNTNIKIKSIDGLTTFRTINILVTDSLNMQTVFNGSSFFLNQISICGINKVFQLGVTTPYTGGKTITWKLNSSTLSNRTSLIDTFTQGGTYSVTLTTNSGCRATKEITIIKNNSTFNPGFSANRQTATSPPFDFTFANQTQPLSDYNYFWKWGDGITDSTNNQVIFKTYSNNGQYTVKLIAQHKVTACKDSVTEVNYITCSGFNPQPLAATTTKQNPYCAGEANGNIAVSATGGITPYTYRINGGSYQNNNVFNNLVAGIYTIDVKDAANNVVTRKDTLINPPAVTVGTITGPNNVSINSIQSYSIAVQTGASYLWNVINGTLLSGNGTNSIQVQWPASTSIGKIIASVNKGNCSATDSLTIAITPQPLSLFSNKQNPFCTGEATGNITINANGGIPPYQYKLNNGSYQSGNSFTNLSAGVYDVYVKDAQNNVVSKKDTLVSPLPLTVGSINGLNGVPAGSAQSYSVTAQLGSTYNWSVINGTLLSGNGSNTIQVQWPALTGTGKVIISLTKNGCSAIDSMVISIGSNPLVLNLTHQNESCPGKNDGSISVNATGGNPPYVYSINNGTYQSGGLFGGLSGGVYWISVKDNNQIVVTKYDTLTTGVKPTAGIITGPTSVAKLAINNYIVGQQTGLNYLWSVKGGVVAGGQNTNIAQVAWGSQPIAGKVYVVVTNSGGCSDSSSLDVNVGSVGLNEVASNGNVKVYPNPNNGSFLIDALNNTIEEVEIFNSIGALVWRYTSKEQIQTTLNINLNEPSGVYVINIKTQQGIARHRLLLTK